MSCIFPRSPHIRCVLTQSLTELEALIAFAGQRASASVLGSGVSISLASKLSGFEKQFRLKF